MGALSYVGLSLCLYLCLYGHFRQKAFLSISVISAVYAAVFGAFTIPYVLLEAMQVSMPISSKVIALICVIQVVVSLFAAWKDGVKGPLADVRRYSLAVVVLSLSVAFVIGCLTG